MVEHSPNILSSEEKATTTTCFLRARKICVCWHGGQALCWEAGGTDVADENSPDLGSLFRFLFRQYIMLFTDGTFVIHNY